VVLKDVFDLSLEEIAEGLSTSVGAVKAALHRGRGKLSEPDAPEDEVPVPVPAVLDAFCEAFNARDLKGLTALLLDTVVSEFPGLTIEYGAKTAETHSLRGVLFGDPAGQYSPIGRAYRTGLQSRPPRLELRVHRGEPLLLGWFLHDDGEAVRAISRITVEGDKISRMATYMHTPEVLAEVCAELQVPYRSSGYRYW
jgi:RNA polymerase sigma-70 factor (ECF subfamily)